MRAVESLRGFVNFWNCDENAHLNVQFYFGFFEDAAGHFLAEAGIPPQARPAPLARHVRFHSELLSGQLLRIESHAARGSGTARWHLVHRMVEPDTGRLAATALDSFGEGDAAAALTLADGTIPEEALPRSLELAPPQSEAGQRELSAAMVTHRGRFQAAEIRSDGHPRHGAIVRLFSDANAHLWEGVGVAQRWLEERDYGRVAVEMKVSRTKPIGEGLVHVLSTPTAIARKTITFRHLVIASDTGAVVAVGDLTSLLLDRKKRRSAELPETVRRKILEEFHIGSP